MAIFYLYKMANSILLFDKFDCKFLYFSMGKNLLMVSIKMCKVM